MSCLIARSSVPMSRARFVAIDPLQRFRRQVNFDEVHLFHCSSPNKTGGTIAARELLLVRFLVRSLPQATHRLQPLAEVAQRSSPAAALPPRRLAGARSSRSSRRLSTTLSFSTLVWCRSCVFRSASRAALRSLSRPTSSLR